MDINTQELINCMDENEFYLPVGYRDADGKVHRVVTLTPMTGEVEEAMAEPKLKDNAGKIVTEIIFGIVEKLGSLKKVTKDVIRELTVADRDFILLKNSEVSKASKELNYVDSCTLCGKQNEVHTNTGDIPVKNAKDDEVLEITFELKHGYKDGNGNVHKTITVGMPNGTVQERISPLIRVNQASATTMLIHSLTRKLGTLDYVTPEIIKKLTKVDRDLISRKLGELDFGAKLSTTVQCSHCGEDYTSPININALLGE